MDNPWSFYCNICNPIKAGLYKTKEEAEEALAQHMISEHHNASVAERLDAPAS